MGDGGAARRDRSVEQPRMVGFGGGSGGQSRAEMRRSRDPEPKARTAKPTKGGEGAHLNSFRTQNLLLSRGREPAAPPPDKSSRVRREGELPVAVVRRCSDRSVRYIFLHRPVGLLASQSIRSELPPTPPRRSMTGDDTTPPPRPFFPHDSAFHPRRAASRSSLLQIRRAPIPPPK